MKKLSQCFSSGAEGGRHRSTHDYQVIVGDIFHSFLIITSTHKILIYIE